MKKVKVRFNDRDVYIFEGVYGYNGNRSLLGYTISEEGNGQKPIYEPYMTITVNTEKKYDNDTVVIKNYSENEGILDSLQEAGFVKEIKGMIPLGYTHGVVIKLPNDLKFPSIYNEDEEEDDNMVKEFDINVMRELTENDLFMAKTVANMLVKERKLSVEKIYEIVYNSYVLDGYDYINIYNELYEELHSK